jgi:energy-coupling factor transport system permease protein
MTATDAGAEAAAAPQPRENRQPRPVVLLRPIPGRSAIHDLWAGTKLIVVFAISVLLTFYPGWVPIVSIGLLVLVAARLAHVPRGTLPTIPKWLWALIAFGAGTAALAGGTPYLELGPLKLGLGGFLDFARINLLALVLLGVCLMVSWTTNIADVAPAIAKLGRPFKVFRIPVDDWAVATALALRAFPMLIDEFRVLYAARKLRPKPLVPDRRSRFRRKAFELVDLLAAAITAALRRGDEMGDAITARGGAGQISALPSRPTWIDGVALVIVLAVCGAAVWVELFTPLATS